MAEEGWVEPGLTQSYGILLLDGSQSMQWGKELKTGKPKHRAVAEMTLDLIQELRADPEIQHMFLTVICYDGRWVDEARIYEYLVKENPEWHYNKPYPEEVIDKLDPIDGHGGQTPIGLAFGFAKELAQEWVLTAPGGFFHRAVICLLTDGSNDPKGTKDNPDGTEEKREIQEFNKVHEKGKGWIRVATVGYYQHKEGEDKYEDDGRRLLRRLADPHAYFETDQASKIASFLRRSMKAGMTVETE